MTAAFDAKAFVATLPGLPGVYRMLGAQGEVLYVGKARDLKKRVASYFTKTASSPRIGLMVAQICAIETTVTRSEGEALLLENNLIKSLTPRYNILFRDDKSYPYLMITGHAYPRIGFHRGAQEKPHRYFGPFPHSSAVRESIQLLQRVFRLRTCEDSVFEHRSRPCLLHQIDRCTAPCTQAIRQEDYANDVRNAELFLLGRENDLIDQLTTQMNTAAEEQRYEDAARYRDRIRDLSRVQARQYVESAVGVDADVVACYAEAGMTCVNLVMIRAGRHVGDRSFFPMNATDAPIEEVLAAFLSQHYLEQPIPPLIVGNAAMDGEVLEEALSEQSGRPVRWVFATQGERRVWVEMAEKNAQLALANRLREKDTQEARIHALRAALDLPESAQRIECFDISHTMGEATVASCVVYDAHAMQPSQYRRFNIRDITPGDDYAAMRQALSRRYERINAEAGLLPDVILIDGGKGQVSQARSALSELGLNDMVLIGVAKGPERKPGLETLIIETTGQAIDLPAQHPGLHLIQQIRDEAHRFAITGHRARRAKTRTQSELTEIPGIGDKRRRALLTRFGGLRGLQSAAVDDIAAVEGIGRATAEKIHRHLHADAGVSPRKR